MATVKELQARLDEVTRLLAQYGIEPTPTPGIPEDRDDFIKHGSDEHAQFLGLVPVTDETKRKIQFTSPRTGRVFALEDEVTPFMQYPDPRQVAELVLEQKVNVLETVPEVPAHAPPMQVFRDAPM
jgi:hypothetical protein